MSAAGVVAVVLISGRGSNLKALIDATRRERLALEIRTVVSNEPGAAGLLHAERAGIETRVLDHRGFASREDFDAALAALIDARAPALVILAGFMRILGSAFVRRYHGRLINVHPSLLPAFPGLDTHRRALDAGVDVHGASVHFVSEELDGGPLIVQAPVEVRPGDDVVSLAARVLEEEHRIYPLAVRWFAEGRIELRDGRAWVDGRPAPGGEAIPERRGQ